VKFDFAVGIITWIFDGEGEFKPRMMRFPVPGDGTGVHDLAVVFEVGMFAGLYPSAITCQRSKRRLADAKKHYGYNYMTHSEYKETLERMVNFICKCECGEIDGE